MGMKSAPDSFELYGDEHRPLSKDEIKKIKKWLAIRKEAGRHIDPKTAEVTWDFRATLDPYCVVPPHLYEDLLGEADGGGVGREYFARAPGSRVWVHFGDLPAKICKALLKMYHHRLCSFVAQGGRVKHNPPVVLKGGKVVEAKKRRAVVEAKEPA
jgi:hypothetical protein